jgi:hypothetical protein
MNDEARFLYLLWEAVYEFIPMGDRQDAAAQMIRVLLEQGNDIHLLHDAEGEDVHLDRALAEVSAEQDEEEEIDEIEEIER